MLKSQPFAQPQLLQARGQRPRVAAAVALRGASAVLARLARRLRPATMPRGEPVLEFYAEAGAPEGALFIDGKLVGVLNGVTRL